MKDEKMNNVVGINYDSFIKNLCNSDNSNSTKDNISKIGFESNFLDKQKKINF